MLSPKKLIPVAPKARLTITVLMLAAAAVAVYSLADVKNEALTEGKVDLKSATALEMGPGGVLFVGDSQTSTVYAVEVGSGESSGKLANIEDLDEKLAGLLGTGVRDILIQDLAVDEGSGTIYLAVQRGRGDDGVPVLVRISKGGELSEVKLDKVRYSSVELPNAPAEDAKLYRWDSRGFTITDMELIDGELYVAGLTNEEFASQLRRIPYPFAGGVEATGLEIYHGAHGAYETFAPIFSFTPYKIGDEDQLLASYLCTPLVTFPLDEVKKSDKLRGKTIAELGWGNIPTDIIPYENDEGRWVLLINNRRGNMKISAEDIAAAQGRDGITKEVGPRVGVEDHTIPLGHIVQAASYDAENVVLLGRSMENGSLYLQLYPKSRL